ALKTLLEKPGLLSGQRRSISKKIIAREDNLNRINDIIDRIEQKSYFGSDEFVGDLPVGGKQAAGGEGAGKTPPPGGGGGGDIILPNPKQPADEPLKPQKPKADFPLDRTLQGVARKAGRPEEKPGVIVRAIETFNREAGMIPSILKKVATRKVDADDPVKAINAYRDFLKEHKYLSGLANWSKQAGFKAASTTGFDIGGASVIYPAFHIRNALTFATQALVNNLGNVDKGVDAIIAGAPHAVQGAAKSILSFLNVIFKGGRKLVSKTSMKEASALDRIIEKNWFGNEISRIAHAAAFNKADDLAKITLKEPLRIRVSPDYYDANHGLTRVGDNTLSIKTGDELYKIALEHDVQQGFTTTELFEEQLASGKKALPRGTMEAVETGGRMSFWVGLLKEEGLSASHAAQVVRDVFFDYSTIGKADRTARAIMPFAKYTLEALPKAIETTVRRPGLVQGIRKLPAIAGGEETEPLGYDDSLKLIFPGGTTGVGFPTIFEEYTKFAGREGAARTLAKQASNLTPPMRVALELALGQSLYKGKPLTSYDFFLSLLSGVGMSRLVGTINRMSDKAIQGLVSTVYESKKPTIMERWLPIITGLPFEQIDKDKEYEKMVKRWLTDKVARGEEGLWEFRSFVTTPTAPEDLRKIVEDYRERQRK
ncbi:MAG: hypothetical protein MN733_13490, partial [Nitrososphaera sp.]|nr:hypothetical protein [Nitrososphaera sp.]